jgi:hypothetical protein
MVARPPAATQQNCRLASICVLNGLLHIGGTNDATEHLTAYYSQSHGYLIPHCWETSIIASYKARMGAGLQFVFLVVATFSFHDFWKFDG